MVTRSTAYPFAVVRLECNWSAGALQWQSALTAPNRDDLNRVTDPLYFGHTSKTLRAVADALGRDVRVRLERRSRFRRQPVARGA